jgi:hypothetical protein
MFNRVQQKCNSGVRAGMSKEIPKIIPVKMAVNPKNDNTMIFNKLIMAISRY